MDQEPISINFAETHQGKPAVSIGIHLIGYAHRINFRYNAVFTSGSPIVLDKIVVDPAPKNISGRSPREYIPGRFKDVIELTAPPAEGEKNG